MLSEVSLLDEGVVALWAYVGSSVFMQISVSVECGTISESLATVGAGVWFLPSMKPQMGPQLPPPGQHFVANVARYAKPFVSFGVLHKIPSVLECFIAAL